MPAYDQEQSTSVALSENEEIQRLQKRMRDVEDVIYGRTPHTVGFDLWNQNVIDPGHVHERHVVRYIGCTVFVPTATVTTGDGKFYVHIPKGMEKLKLDYVHARVVTSGTTGTTDIQIANVTDTVDMLSTKLTIDSAETGSNTAATAAVINAANDEVAENDILRIDVDAVSTTAPIGLTVTLGFRIKA